MGALKDWSNASPAVKRNVLRRVGTMIFFDLLIAAAIFLSAGKLACSWGWLYVALFVLIQLGGAFLLPLEVLAERGSKKENAEKWDTVITTAIFPCFMGVYIVSGLDNRWGWSGAIGLAWHLVGTLFFLLGCLLEMWAMYANRFFSSAVRIQAERGHTVCDTGPYRCVRHPGYVGIIVYFLFTPPMLGSWWGLIPAALTGLLLVLRTVMEDRTLQAKLPGYDEYTRRVRWRLLPGVW